MQKIILNYPVNKVQRIFIAKSTELLYKGSLDTYKLKLHNPKSLVEELVSTCQLTYPSSTKSPDFVHFLKVLESLKHVKSLPTFNE